MCCVHKQDCKCFSVDQRSGCDFCVRFTDGSLVGTFCERRVARVVAWLLNRRTSIETLINYIFHVLQRIKIIEDCEHERFISLLAHKLCDGDEVKAEEKVRETMYELQEERNYV